MMMPPEEYGFDFDPAEENFDDFMDDEEALVNIISVITILFQEQPIQKLLRTFVSDQPYFI